MLIFGWGCVVGTLRPLPYTRTRPCSAEFCLYIWEYPPHLGGGGLKPPMCSSRKNPYPSHGRSLEIPRGRAVLKANILEAKYVAKLEFFWGGEGAKQKPSMGEYGYFLELHNPSESLIKSSLIEIPTC